MSDEQIIEKLARRMGYIDLKWDWFDGHSTWKDWTWTRGGQHGHGLPNYLASRDALAPILEGLSDGERRKLDLALEKVYMASDDPASSHGARMWILSLTARELAPVLASILEDKQ